VAFQYGATPSSNSVLIIVCLKEMGGGKAAKTTRFEYVWFVKQNPTQTVRKGISRHIFFPLKFPLMSKVKF